MPPSDGGGSGQLGSDGGGGESSIGLLIAKRRKAEERMNWELEKYFAIANVNLSVKILTLLVFVVICG